MKPELLFASDAELYGSGRRSLALRCRAGELIRLRSGIYVRSDVWRQLPRWEQNLVRVRATAEQVPGQRVLIQQSAATIWGLPVIGTGSEVLLLASAASHGRRRGDLRWSARRLLEPLEVVDGLTLTSRAQTVLDMAAYLDFERAVPAMDRVMNPDPLRGLPGLKKENLRELAGNLPDQAKRLRARRVVDFADARSESAGESYSRAVLHRLGFPAPELQHEFRTPAGRFRTDFYWAEHDLVGEFDGAVKYGANVSTIKPSWETLTQEKRREDAIRATGTVVVRWSWNDIGRPGEHPESLTRKMLGAGLLRSRRHG
ncbi:hypothetical protein [Arthrobacter sp. zg-Y877]|uniref:hypothetical protein n=1 Tax=Arthrobacter sp. zg-Y877 TaxID=3049074 RepID=UPI0025A47688|nr:hypothetical protein [Arthrobacter sp. zg-Y877]MDM7990432.1 hypothetical protein [Arthrobacter sp. zg-Y877]